MHRRTPSADARVTPNAFYAPPYNANNSGPLATTYQPPPGPPPDQKPPKYGAGPDYENGAFVGNKDDLKDPFADFEPANRAAATSK